MAMPNGALAIERLGIVGAGQMGRGIAQLAATHGIDVVLADAGRDLAERARGLVAQQLAALVGKGKLTPGAREEILGRIHPADLYTDLESMDFVIEAATESPGTKREIFRALEVGCRPGVILASNTSSISITAIASAVMRPGRVIGMHFMNPPPLMALVELVRGLATTDETYATTRALAERLGKTTVLSRDVPGFIVNRLLMPMLNEACYALFEGIGTVEDLDVAVTLGLKHPMGPMTLMDLIGLDTTLSILEVLHHELGDPKYRPCPLLRQYVAAGWLGRKTGRGFRTYGPAGAGAGDGAAAAAIPPASNMGIAKT
jgi:3-hydroxybutyryl-CoA dehydrogenase